MLRRVDEVSFSINDDEHFHKNWGCYFPYADCAS